ncbi:hypothetical protein VTK26DRAFT_3667 [Humicola hyalothermophila]
MPWIDSGASSGWSESRRPFRSMSPRPSMSGPAAVRRPLRLETVLSSSRSWAFFSSPTMPWTDSGVSSGSTAPSRPSRSSPASLSSRGVTFSSRGPTDSKRPPTCLTKSAVSSEPALSSSVTRPWMVSGFRRGSSAAKRPSRSRPASLSSSGLSFSSRLLRSRPATMSSSGPSWSNKPWRSSSATASIRGEPFLTMFWIRAGAGGWSVWAR